MASSMTDMVKIDVSLSDTDVAIDPGSVSQLTVTITNRQTSPDRVALEIEGVDVEWYAIPVPVANIAPGGQAVLKVPFKVARDSSNRAGTYPFLVRVQAMESGEIGVAQASLNVRAYNSLQVELNPKRAIATFFNPLNDFDFTLVNQGNVEETLDLFASDQDDSCAFEFDVDRLILKPGQTSVVPLAVRPKVATFLGGNRIYGFTASARSHDDAYVSANSHGQIEKHALISPFTGIFLLLLGLAGGAFALFRPKPMEPVKIIKFAAIPHQLVQGQTTVLTWEVSGLQTANRHLILSHTDGKTANEITDVEVREDNGSMKVTPEGSTTYILKAFNSGGTAPMRREAEVKVTAAPPPPKPVISNFEAFPLKIHQGEAVMLKWTAKNQEYFILDDGNIKLSKVEQSRLVNPETDATFKLRAFNGKSDFVEKDVSVKVFPANVCIAEIVSFGFKEKPVYIGDEVQLRWSSRYSRGAKLSCSDLDIDALLATVNGSITGTGVSKPIKFGRPDSVTFTLTVTDSAGQSISKAFTVTPKYHPAPPPPEPQLQTQPDPGAETNPSKPPTNP